MVVCYFGNYNPHYSRNQILIKGLELNGVTVLACQSRQPGILKYIDLVVKHWHLRGKYEVMIVGFPGYQSMLLAKLLCRRPIIFDAFASLYDSMILDRRLSGINSLRAWYYRWLDRLAINLADKVLLDTQAQIDFFVRIFSVKPDKLERIFVGSDDSVFQPRPKTTDTKLVHFHGTHIPLQGISYIIEAADKLVKDNIKFNIIGSQIKKKYDNGSHSNINFINNVPLADLTGYMAQADIALGIFGNTDKASRVIPNKVYEAIAVAKPVITGDSPAVRELLKSQENVILVRLADSQALAQAIKDLLADKAKMAEISHNGYELFKSKLTPLILGKELKEIVYAQVK